MSKVSRYLHFIFKDTLGFLPGYGSKDEIPETNHGECEMFQKLLEPFEIGRVKLRNRMVKLPAIMGFADRNGYVSERNKNFYETLARGGVGMITVESTYIDGPLCMTRKGPYLSICDDRFISGLSELAQVIHKHGCPAFLQLGHDGPAHSQSIEGLQPVAASSISKREMPNPLFDVARMLTVPEIQDIVNNFAKAAERAQKAGFDGIELHGAHPYLINSFLSRAYNKRGDAYGCQDLKSRCRFAVECIQTVKGRTGKDYPVGIRINGVELGIEKGLTCDETQGIGQILP